MQPTSSEYKLSQALIRIKELELENQQIYIKIDCIGEELVKLAQRCNEELHMIGVTVTHLEQQLKQITE